MIHKPKHPGVMIRNLCLKPLGLSVAEAARLLGISRSTLVKTINGELDINPEIAARLAIVFNTSPEIWINLQAGYNRWQAHKIRGRLHLNSVVPRVAC